MNSLEDRKLIGGIIRKRRKELGLLQKDLTDKKLSPTVISYIETGKKKVSKKTIAYLCQKLNLDLNNLPKYLKESKVKESLRLAEIKVKLKSIETDIDCVGAKFALRQLKEIETDGNPYLEAIVEYLKGKCYSKKKNWKRALEHYQQAMTMIVNNKAINVIGLITGMKLFSYHSRPFAFTKTSRVIIPATKGIPR